MTGFLCSCKKCQWWADKAEIKVPETPRARLIKVQDEVNSLFTDVMESGRNGRNVHEALVALRWVLKVLEHAVLRMGRI